ADGAGTAGVGIAMTDSTHITLTDITTTGNAWGSVALYTTGTWFAAGTGDITFQGTYSHDEPIGIFSQDESATADLGTVTFPPSFTGDGDGTFVVTNDSHRLPGGDSDTFTYFFGSEEDAAAFALTLAHPERSVVTAPDAEIIVTDGMSIQAAIDAAPEGATIIVKAGTYAEQLSITKAITIEAEEGAVLEGTLLTHLGVPNGTHLSDFMEANHPGYSAGGTGITIGADDVSVSGLTIKGFIIGVQIGTSNGVSLTGNTITETITGLVKGTEAQVTGFTLNDNTFSHGIQGIIIQAASNGNGSFDGITMNDNTFTDLSEKGMYFEQIANASLTGNSFDDVGNYGRIAPPFGPASQDGEFGQAIDINLKYETYSNVVFTDTTITNSGNSDKNGTDDPGDFGAAIGVKIRDDAPSYGSVPGDFAGPITFDGLTIDGTSTGIRVGEPGKNNGGPDVSLIDVKITDASVSDVQNVTHKTLGGVVTIDLADDEAGFDGTGSQAPLVVHGNDLGNTLKGGDGNDTLTGGKGTDTLEGGGGSGDVAHFAGARDGYLIEQTGQGTYRVTDIDAGDGDDGVDTLTGIEGVTFGGTPGIVFELDAHSPTYGGSVVRYNQDFSENTDGIVTQIGGDGYGAIERVGDGTWHGVTSADGDGFYGVVRFAEAAREIGL
ncbi:MAG TPA: NosD domain-containing protein, partial [Bauldia sp.]|nr:NosD domain-containing protein [Bauldia sp.]